MKPAIIKIRGSGSAVYLLKKNADIVYIGSSSKVLGRFAGHVKKDYDEVEIRWCKEKDRADLERELIGYYRPKLNIFFIKKRKCDYAKKFNTNFKPQLESLKIGDSIQFEDRSFQRYFYSFAKSIGICISMKFDKRTMIISATRKS